VQNEQFRILGSYKVVYSIQLGRMERIRTVTSVKNISVEFLTSTKANEISEKA
jgi:hypothetical protein